jgi:hypothetical protein
MIASYSNLTIPWVTGALLTSQDLILLKRLLCHTPGRQMLSYEYEFCHAAITRTSSIKNVGIFFDSKLRFRNHLDFLFSECLKLLSLIRSITSRFSSLGLFTCAILDVSQVQVGICVGSLEFYHVYQCQQDRAHPEEVCVRLSVCLFLSFFPLTFYIVLLLP